MKYDEKMLDKYNKAFLDDAEKEVSLIEFFGVVDKLSFIERIKEAYRVLRTGKLRVITQKDSSLIKFRRVENLTEEKEIT